MVERMSDPKPRYERLEIGTPKEARPATSGPDTRERSRRSADGDTYTPPPKPEAIVEPEAEEPKPAEPRVKATRPRTKAKRTRTTKKPAKQNPKKDTYQGATQTLLLGEIQAPWSNNKGCRLFIIDKDGNGTNSIGDRDTLKLECNQRGKWKSVRSKKKTEEMLYSLAGVRQMPNEISYQEFANITQKMTTAREEIFSPTMDPAIVRARTHEAYNAIEDSSFNPIFRSELKTEILRIWIEARHQVIDRMIGAEIDNDLETVLHLGVYEMFFTGELRGTRPTVVKDTLGGLYTRILPQLVDRLESYKSGTDYDGLIEAESDVQDTLLVLNKLGNFSTQYTIDELEYLRSTFDEIGLDIINNIKRGGGLYMPRTLKAYHSLSELHRELSEEISVLKDTLE